MATGLYRLVEVGHKTSCLQLVVHAAIAGFQIVLSAFARRNGTTPVVDMSQMRQSPNKTR